MDLIDPEQWLRFGAALVFVLALMGVLGLVMRRLHSGQMPVNTGKRRLKIVESLTLDPRRKLVLIRRDNREHLVILGTNSETLIESGIESRQDEAVTLSQNPTE